MDSDRVIPDTYVVCNLCGEMMLRSKIHDHTHPDEETGFSYRVQLIRKGTYQVDVDPDSPKTKRELVDAARTKAAKEFLDSRRNFSVDVNILGVEPSIE